MNFNIEGILDINEISNYEIIATKDLCNSIDLNDSYSIDNIEILSISVLFLDKKIKKISNKNSTIYAVNFTYFIKIYIAINSKFEEIKFKDIHYFSFIYKNIDTNYLDVEPINLELNKFDKKLKFGVNFIVIDKSNNTLFEKINNDNNQSYENINNKDYSYININQEFI